MQIVHIMSQKTQILGKSEIKGANVSLGCNHGCT